MTFVQGIVRLVDEKFLHDLIDSLQGENQLCNDDAGEEA